MDDKPDYQSPDYAELNARWAQVDCVLGGTKTMRLAGTLYLPQFPSEEGEVYNKRLATSSSDGDYGDTLDAIVGMIFRKPAKAADDVPARIVTDLENVDLQGTHFNVFAPRLTRKGIHYGASYILVDMQRTPASVEGQTLDLATSREMGLRPYWTIYPANAVQSRPRYVSINGARTLQQIVFKECVVEPSGDYGSGMSERLRVWRLPVEELEQQESYRVTGPVEWELWEKQEVEGTDKKDWSQEASGTIKLDRIPVAVFMANPAEDDELACGGPTLEDLSYICIEDWQAQSDFKTGLHYMWPVPYTVGLREIKTELAWGPSILLDCDTGGKADFAEPHGNALSTWKDYLASIKEKIRQKGLEMVLEEGAPNTTATEQIIRAGKRASRLTYWIDAVHDCFEEALQFHAQWLGMGADQGGEITMGVTGTELILTAQELTALNAAVIGKVMSLKTYYDILQRAGLLSDSFDADAEIQQIKDEGDILAPPVPTLQVGKASSFAQNANPAIAGMFGAKAKPKTNGAANGQP